MSKNDISNMQNVIANTVDQVLTQIEGQALNPEYQQQAAKAFEEAVSNVEQVAAGTVQETANNIKDQIGTKLNEIDGLPDNAKKILQNGANKIVDEVSVIANDTIKEAGAEGRKIFADCIKQMVGAVKIIFDNIGAVINKGKSQEKAIDDVKSAWVAAGKEVLESARQSGEKLKTSFVDRVGGKKSQDPDKSHGDKILDERNQPKSQDKNR